MRKEAPPPPGPLRSSRRVQTDFFYFLQMQSPPTVHQATCQSKNYLELENNLEKKVEGGVVAHSPDRRANCHARGEKWKRPLFDLISFKANPKKIERKKRFFKFVGHCSSVSTVRKCAPKKVIEK